MTSTDTRHPLDVPVATAGPTERRVAMASVAAPGIADLIPGDGPRTDPRPIRLLTLNVHKGFSFFNKRFVLPELREAVRATAADVVLLQEVVGEHRTWATRHAGWPDVPQYEFLADTLWTQYAYGRNAVYPEGDHGNGVLSRFPIVHQANIDVTTGADERRGLLHCILDLPDESEHLHVICVHLGLREAERRAQVRCLLDHIEEAIPATAALVVGGDFNDWRSRLHGPMYQAGLRETFIETRGSAARTFPARWPRLRLDRFYVRHLQIAATEVLGRRPWPHLSDHVPLLAEVRL